MRNRLANALLVVTGVLLCWDGPAMAAGASARGAMFQRFEQQAPQVGERAPDLDAFRADGSPFKLRSLEGHYAVVVFGCLT